MLLFGTPTDFRVINDYSGLGLNSCKGKGKGHFCNGKFKHNSSHRLMLLDWVILELFPYFIHILNQNYFART
jgi:hypothetical protein